MLLLAAGLATALLAGAAGAADFLGDARIRAHRKARPRDRQRRRRPLQALSLYLRYRWGLEGVVPAGVILSLLGLGLLAVTGWKGGELVLRPRVAVLDHADAPPAHSPRLNIAEPGPAPPGARTPPRRR